MKARILLLLTLLAATSAEAGSRACNPTLVSQGICRDAANQVLFYDASTAAMADLRDAIVRDAEYTAQVRCTTERTFRPLVNGAPSKVLVSAGVTTDSCTLGAAVANPQTTSAFADAVIQMEQRNRVIRDKHRQALEAVPGPGTIETPDLGMP